MTFIFHSALFAKNVILLQLGSSLELVSERKLANLGKTACVYLYAGRL